MTISINNLSKKFKKNLILNNINMNLESGNIYGFIGRNGSGKSVLLKIICGFYKPTTGEVLFDGTNVIENQQIPKNTRALIEKPQFLSYLSGFENLKVLAKILNLIDDEKINDTLKLVGLFDDKDKKYREYSLGMKQKLGIAQVLMENPDVIILDEPFNGIDDESINLIRETLLILKNKNKLIIIASHIKEDIDILADVVYKFENNNAIKIDKIER